MELLLKRIARKPNYTIGKLYIDGVYFCDTIEDTDRGLSDSMSVAQVKSIKKPHITAIPTGRYELTIGVVSPKYSQYAFYKQNANNGRVPRILNVKGFDGILMHCGNTEKDSSGCIILGQNKVVGKVINSQETFKKFYPILQKAKGKIYITIE